jgi:hypothetical protein
MSWAHAWNITRTPGKNLEGKLYGIQLVGKSKGRWREAGARDDIKMLGMAEWELLVFDRKTLGRGVQTE